MRVALPMGGICDQVLAKVIAAYQARALLLCRILQSEPRIRIHTPPQGGFFVWISLDGIDDTSQDFCTYCRDRGVGFLPGSRCGAFVKDDDTRSSLNYSDNETENTVDHCRQYARLCFADMDEEDLEQGAKLLVQCYRNYMETR